MTIEEKKHLNEKKSYSHLSLMEDSDNQNIQHLLKPSARKRRMKMNMWNNHYSEVTNTKIDNGYEQPMREEKTWIANKPGLQRWSNRRRKNSSWYAEDSTQHPGLTQGFSEGTVEGKSPQETNCKQGTSGFVLPRNGNSQMHRSILIHEL